MVKYYWEGTSDDGSFHSKSANYFDTALEAYNDMRDDVFATIKEETDYEENFDPDRFDEVLDYKLEFSKKEISFDCNGPHTFKVKAVRVASEKLQDKVYGIMNLINEAITDARNEALSAKEITDLMNANFDLETFLHIN